MQPTEDVIPLTCIPAITGIHIHNVHVSIVRGILLAIPYWITIS